MKNILLIIDALGKGGAENSLAKLSVILSKTHRVHILIFFSDGSLLWDTSGEIININEPPSISLLDSVVKIFRRLRKIKRIKKELNIDTSISFMEGINFYNILSRNKDKIIISVRGSKLGDIEARNTKGRIINFLMKWLYERADVIAVVSIGIKNELVSYYNLPSEMIKVVYDSYDVQKIQIMADEEIDDKYKPIFKAPVLINSGRLHVQKGHCHLLSIFFLLRKKDPSLKLLILGDGLLKEELNIICSNLKLKAYAFWDNNAILDDSSDVYFLGFTKNPFKYIKKSKLFLFPSLYEGFPNALCEAMLLGIPVITTDCPTGPREILDNENVDIIDKDYYRHFGVLMPPFIYQGDNRSLYNEWSDIIFCLLNDKILMEKYSISGSLRAKTFSNEKAFEQWDKII